MSINATILGQMITFAIFVLFTMKFVWPLLNNALVERKDKIMNGLIAAEHGHKTLQDAKTEAQIHLSTAKTKAESIISNANQLASNIIDEAKNLAVKEKNEIILNGKKQVELSYQQAKVDLQSHLSKLVIIGVEKILSRSIDVSDHKSLLDNMTKDI